MKAPVDKLRAGGNNIMQIIVTTACDLYTCSNCTQLLPFRKDTRHMSLECFEKAVASMEGWSGVVSLFGGNPCSHPKFEELCAILKRLVPDQRRRGLWSNALLGKGGVARDTFYPHGRFNLNAHADQKAAAEIEEWLPGKLIRESRKASWHAPIFLDPRSFGIEANEWPAIRETCDINRDWSGAIRQGPDETPQGYFCEVAASLDGARGMNHGVPAIPGWWQSGMGAFAGQVAGCCDAGCGVPLRRQGQLDVAHTYDVTPDWIGRLGTGRGVELKVHTEMPVGTERATDYLGRWTDKTKVTT